MSQSGKTAIIGRPQALPREPRPPLSPRFNEKSRIEGWYNARRLHSSISYLTPIEKDDSYYESHRAAQPTCPLKRVNLKYAARWVEVRTEGQSTRRVHQSRLLVPLDQRGARESGRRETRARSRGVAGMESTENVRQDDYRSWVGPRRSFDIKGAGQFSLLTLSGLREDHTLLDIGCGSLRAGRLFLSYLAPGNYFGIEPAEWVLQEGIRELLGQEFIEIRRPTFSSDANFTLTTFGREFDYLVAHSVFSHTSLAQMRRCFEQAQQVVKPTSLFFATFAVGDTDYAGDEWVYPRGVRFRPKTVRAVAADHGFSMKLLDWHHPSQQWAVFYPTGSKPPRTPVSLAAHRAQVRKLKTREVEREVELKAALQKAERRLQRVERRLQVVQSRYDRLQRHPAVRFQNAGRRILRRLVRR
jgi:SAM-dependent methyltransferase